ncbi:unnamed protein product [Closterium sp. NIES-64]|nr:unnamed protein product [Closterium sp. NIES-64]
MVAWGRGATAAVFGIGRGRHSQGGPDGGKSGLPLTFSDSDRWKTSNGCGFAVLVTRRWESLLVWASSGGIRWLVAGLAIAIMFSKALAVWLQTLLIGPTASFGSDTANFPLYSEVARWYASGVTAVLALMATKLLGRPILSPVPIYSFAGAGAAITITAVCIRELNGRIGIGATCMVYALCTLSLLLWQSILSGAPMLVGSCSGSSPVAAVAWRRMHSLRLLGCLLACLVAYSCWLWFPPASEAARVLLPSATPLYLWPPASMGVRYWWWIGPLAVPIFAFLLFCSDGLAVALQERVYLQYDLPVTSLVLYVSTSALFVDFWAFAFSDHFDRAFGFVFDCPQCLLYLVLASVPSALATFLTALLLRVSGGLVSSLVLRVVMILLLFPLDPFAPLWKVPQILTGVVATSPSPSPFQSIMVVAMCLS